MTTKKEKVTSKEMNKREISKKIQRNGPDSICNVFEFEMNFDYPPPKKKLP